MKKSILTLVVLFLNIYADWNKELKIFNLTTDPIDIVIACHEKDRYTLEYCIKSAKKFVTNARRIIVISEKQLSDSAEWFDESKFPFSKKSIADEFAAIDPSFNENISKKQRVGWYFKQIMNFYATFVIPGISDNMLILDADIIFVKPVTFVDSNGTMLHAPSAENHQPYYEHMGKLLPGLKKVKAHYSGISHHMLFQKPILEDLFNLVESHHKTDFWRAYCRCVDPKNIALSGATDYEIYFNFVLTRTKQIKIRPLKWENITIPYYIKFISQNDYDFFSCHSYVRDDYERYLEKLMLSHADLNLKDKDTGDTPLMFAAQKNQPLLIKAIIHHIKKNQRLEALHATNKNGLSAIHFAIKRNGREAFIELIKQGADLDLLFKNETLPMYAIKNSCYSALPFIKILMDSISPDERKRILDKKNNDNLAALHLAILYHDINVFNTLIEYGADPQIIGPNKNNLIMYAVIYESPESIQSIAKTLTSDKLKKLLEDKNQDGLTPLHLAVRHRVLPCAKLLLELGANKFITNNNGLTPYEYAISFHDDELKEFYGILKL